MLDVLTSASATTFFVWGASVALTVVTWKHGRKPLAWLVALVAPFLLAYLYSRVPVWIGIVQVSPAGDAWWGLGVIIWGGSGAIASVVAIEVYRRLRKIDSPHV
jgi:hypothetical protein